MYTLYGPSSEAPFTRHLYCFTISVRGGRGTTLATIIINYKYTVPEYTTPHVYDLRAAHSGRPVLSHITTALHRLARAIAARLSATAAPLAMFARYCRSLGTNSFASRDASDSAGRGGAGARAAVARGPAPPGTHCGDTHATRARDEHGHGRRTSKCRAGPLPRRRHSERKGE